MSEACEKGPFITTETTIEIPINMEETFIIEGINFNLETDISIPGFTGTIDSFKVLSPMKIQVSVTTNNTIGDYDIVVSNHGNLNTSWPQNGVGLLKITGFNGSTQVAAGRTCKTILDDGLSTGDGIYWINPDEGSTDNAFQVYCDMTTDGVDG